MGTRFLIHGLLGMALIAAAILLSAQQPMLFVNVTGMLVVIGGSAAALFASYPLKDIRNALNQVKRLWQEKPVDEMREVERLVTLARLWQRQDLRAIESALDQTPNRFLQTGVQLLIANVPPGDVAATLGWRIRRLKVREQAEARIFHSLATYAPAFGMLGTLIGLVNMMLGMQDQTPGDMTSHWAVALVTTFYGMVLANLVFKPIATKLERRTEKRLLLMAMMLEGVNLMGMRRSPAYIRENLMSFVTHYDDELASQIEESQTAAPQEPAWGNRP